MDNSQQSMFSEIDFTKPEQSPDGLINFVPTTGSSSSESNQAKPNSSSNTDIKLKAVAALLIVGMGTFVAKWVQEPVDLQADLLGSDQVSSTSNDSSILESSEQPINDSPATSNQITDSLSGLIAQATSSEQFADPSVSTITNKVELSLFGIEPSTLTINKGEFVEWINLSDEEQTVLAISKNDPSINFASTPLKRDETFSKQFDQDDTFEFYSSFNPDLAATLIIGTGGSSSTPTPESNPKPAALETINTNSSTQTLGDNYIAAAVPDSQQTASNEILKQNQKLADSGPEHLLLLLAISAITSIIIKIKRVSI